MRTRTFIGLILLVAALMVASIPALLAPASQGVERLAIEVGVIPDEAKLARERSKELETAQKSNGVDVDSRMLLKGHELQEDGDLRDTLASEERAAARGGRLAAGTTRTAMPGQLVSRADAEGLPAPYGEESMLLDDLGCPRFGEWDPVATWEDPETKQLWLDAAAGADDPAACREQLEATVERSLATQERTLLPGDGRNGAAAIRGDSLRLMIEMERDALLADVFAAWDDAPDEAERLRSELDTRADD